MGVCDGDEVGHFSILVMNPDTPARRVSHATLIPLLLIVIGIIVWGVQYKLSLYGPPGGPSRSIAQAKLLSPNERPDSARTTAQLRPQVPSSSLLLFLDFLIAAVCLGILPTQLVRAKALVSPDVRHMRESISSFFSFLPPPALTLVQ
jgi:hypothetical protein